MGQLASNLGQLFGLANIDDGWKFGGESCMMNEIFGKILHIKDEKVGD
jgi:hypothetical protein